jgi:putative hemolysin
VNQLSQALELTSDEETTQEEQKILEGIVSFGNTDASQVMSPRIDVFALEIEESFKEVVVKIVSKGYSRIPVYKTILIKLKAFCMLKIYYPTLIKRF